MIGTIIIGIYILGILIYCRLNKYRLGEETIEDIGFGNYVPCSIDAETIALESFFWPVEVVLLVIILPIKLLTKIVEL